MPKKLSDIKLLVSFTEELVDEKLVLQSLSELLLKILDENNKEKNNSSDKEKEANIALYTREKE